MIWILYGALLLIGVIFMGIGGSEEDPAFIIFGLILCVLAAGVAFHAGAQTSQKLATDGARSYTVVREAYDVKPAPSFGEKPGVISITGNSYIVLSPAAGVVGKSYKLHVNLVGKDVSLSGSTSAITNGWCFVISEYGSSTVYDQNGVNPKADSCFDGVAHQTH